MNGKPISYRSEDDPLSAQLVLHPGNRGWIIEKFATRLLENLAAWNVRAAISEQPSATADINHWMIYHHCKGARLTPGTVLITHVDDYEKLAMVRESLRVADVGICLSRMTVEGLVKQGISRQQLCYITPGHDGLVAPRRIVIGITTRVRVYAGYRKREDLLLKLADALRLDAFHFKIFGAGWDEIIPRLEAAGATVDYYPGSGDYQRDYKEILEMTPTFDYYLYAGLDEGSMGLLDALAAGVATIVTPQGFHLDIESGITHAFWDAPQMCEIFKNIAEERQRRIDGVKGLTWDSYARQHALVWRALLAGRQSDIPHLLHQEHQHDGQHRQRPRLDALQESIKFYVNPVLRRILRRLGRR
jgi:hypothetical protein